MGGVTFQFIGDHIKGYIPSISDQIFFFFSIILSFCDKKFSKNFLKNISKREKRKNDEKKFKIENFRIIKKTYRKTFASKSKLMKLGKNYQEKYFEEEKEKL